MDWTRKEAFHDNLVHYPAVWCSTVILETKNYLMDIARWMIRGSLAKVFSVLVDASAIKIGVKQQYNWRFLIIEFYSSLMCVGPANRIWVFPTRFISIKMKIRKILNPELKGSKIH